jgi:hypothetical protein
VSPAGKQTTTLSCVQLELVTPDAVEVAMREAGLVPGERRTIPPTDDHVGSVVLVGTLPGAPE